MAFTIKNNEKIAASRESVQGVYATPIAADYILPLADGIELNPAKELLDRDILTPNIGQILPRTGIRSVSGTIGVEARAAGTAGAVPEQGLLVEAALGNVVQRAVTVLPTQAFADQATTFTMTNATDFAMNDIIMIKFAGAFHITPITAVSGTTATILVPIEGVKASASYTIEPVTVYKAANTGHPAFSVTKEVEGDLVEEGLGCRVASYALENFTTGQLPTESFGVDGLTYEWTTGGVDYIASDNIQFNVANGTTTEDSISISVDGGTATVFTYTTPITDAAIQFSTVAELTTLLNGIAGLSAVQNLVSTDEVDLVATQKEGGSIVLTTTDGATGNNPWNKTSVTFNATSPVFEDSLPPVILEACVYQGNKRIIVNEVTFSVENSLGYITSTCDKNGRISSRVTARATTGTFNPYKTASTTASPESAATTLEQFNLFNNNIPYSIFLYAANPILSANVPVEGEFNQVIAYYMPSCLSTEIPEGDADDVLQYNISFSASSGPTGGDADIISAYM